MAFAFGRSKRSRENQGDVESLEATPVAIERYLKSRIVAGIGR